MVSPRWRKVIHDVTHNKTRTFLVVLSIALGVFAIGVTWGARDILTHDMQASYLATNPASATLLMTPFDDQVVQAAREVEGVSEAEGRRSVVVRINTGQDEWKTLELFAVADFDDLRVNTFDSESGAWPPEPGSILLERSSAPFVNTAQGREVQIKTLTGNEHLLKVSGLAHDVGLCPTFMCDTAYGYITLDTAETLGEARDYTQLYLSLAENQFDTEHIREVAGAVRDEVQRQGQTVFLINVPAKPGKHSTDAPVQALLFLLRVIGLFCLALGGFLVINTISALLTQHVRQIGIMKSIGARSGDIAAMYLVMVAAFGVLALIVGVPLSVLGARGLAANMAGMLNFDISSRISVPPAIVVLQIAAGLLVPLLAAIVPVVNGTTITIREAIAGYGLGRGRFGLGMIDRLLERIHFLSRPVLLSLRNTFRRKVRLALTLATLTLAGAVFIAVLSVRASTVSTLQDVFGYWGADVWVIMNRPYPVADIEREVKKLPQVVSAESWLSAGATRLRPDGSDGPSAFVSGTLAETKMVRPTLIAGRWLEPTDEHALVVNTKYLEQESDITVGDDIVLKIQGQETTWKVVGVVRMLLDEARIFINRAHLGELTGLPDQAHWMHVVTQRHDAADQTEAGRRIEAQFEQAGIEVNRVIPVITRRDQAQAQFDIIIVFLMLMAALLAVVGGLGLMGTMSINVIERTREIGVMRSIGASDGDVLKIVMVEGILIGLLSWLFGAILALPLSKPISDAVGNAFLQTPLSFTFSVGGVLLWLLLVVLVAGAACLLPARNASRLTIRDALAYE